MIKSMTGFGRCEAADEERKFTVEMKGVNHRYLDANIRMPCIHIVPLSGSPHNGREDG